jgi:hypothetical protein
MRSLFFALALTGCVVPQVSQELRVTAQFQENRVVLKPVGFGAGVKWYRSYSPFEPKDLDGTRLPIAQVEPIDGQLASGVQYYYLAMQGGRWACSSAVQVPAQRLPARLAQPRIRVDKAHYLLQVWDGQRLCKTYPIVMGRMSGRRKLQYDNASTPEGRYTICNLQPQATYYRAFDIDYPNAVDRARYDLMQPNTDIGGEIQIHGQGIHSNWTFGCMALRNQDMDELFAHPEIDVGTPVWIYGGELTLADLESDAAHPMDPLQLGRWQRSQKLPMTCIYDRATRSRLKGRGI